VKTRRDWLARTSEPEDHRAELPGLPRQRRSRQAAAAVFRGAGIDREQRGPRNPRASRAQSHEKGGLQPLIAGVPSYPADARRRHVEGYADVEFTVTPQGTVEGAHVTASQPKGNLRRGRRRGRVALALPGGAKRAHRRR
jgi:outer membrane biosynthesis protein TonB